MKWWLSVFLSLAFLNPTGAAEQVGDDSTAGKTKVKKAAVGETEDGDPVRKKTAAPFVRKAIEFLRPIVLSQPKGEAYWS